MIRKEYVEYLNTFPEDSEVSFIVANPTASARMQYPVEKMFCITDEVYPITCLEVGHGNSLDEE